MKTLEAIQAEIKALGDVDLFGTKKEVNCLPEIMKDSEHILYLTSGLMYGTTWLIVCTEERIILLDKGMFFGMKQTEMSLDKINSISYNKGLLLGSIEIWHGGARMIIENCTKESVKPFVDAVNNAIENRKTRSSEANVQKAVQNGSSTIDIADQLERLISMVEKGFLSQEEFETQKQKLLNS
ncbi:PH domain-containing protein [Treponema denticola]|uniref:PH domain-containing protein n=1 Tax=Treponema denticola TaxID=158 RepID=UPI0001FD37CF|nr:PH domain-containing protein [Treponema denticola]EGC76458.1 hypothetical protein HMPREF9353_02253 [Treponema denticola F0402]